MDTITIIDAERAVPLRARWPASACSWIRPR